MKVVLHYTAGPVLQRVLVAESSDGIDVSWTPEGDDAALAAAIADAEVLLHVLEPVTAATLERAPRLRLIQKLGVGVNTIDLEAASERGIAVANLPGVNAAAVAEQAIGLMLAVLRRIPTFDRELRAGAGWPLAADVPDRLGEIGGRVVGLIGRGAIAQRVATIVEAMGATARWHGRTDDGDPRWRSLDALLAECDIVSVHLPLTDETSGLIGARELDLLKPGAILVNVGRGGIVDERALAERLADGRIGGAGLDVFATEPVPADSPLLMLGDLDNVVLTPHVAWLTGDTLARCVRLGVANARRLAAGEPLHHRVV